MHSISTSEPGTHRHCGAAQHVVRKLGTSGRWLLPARATRVTLSRLNQRKRHLGVEPPQRWRSAQSRSPHLWEVLDDPDSCSMATSRRGSDVVGYNVQVAVDTEGSGID
jgi:hypothetical protein